MDEGLSAAVRKVFVDLHRQGLIYRDKRLVNWDPLLHTAISDLEVESREVRGKLWTIRYPVEDEPGRFLAVATTRPETMLGDTAVAVHPDDPRYADLIGRRCLLPIVDRPIPIVADEHADPEKGTGAVKITPAHDFNDFEVGRRHGLPMINVLDAERGDAGLHRRAGALPRPRPLRGARRHRRRAARRWACCRAIEDHTLMMPYGDRSGVVVEPWLMDQWFVDARHAGRAGDPRGRGRPGALRAGAVGEDLLRVDAQHPAVVRLPADLVGPPNPRLVRAGRRHLRRAHRRGGAGRGGARTTAIRRSCDAIRTCSTPGSPRRCGRSRRSAGRSRRRSWPAIYPTDVLVTGFDIIFFWVARMMMMGLHFMGDVPFRTVYVHALVRDEKGQKMSKSKGNVIDPLKLIDAYGADALRFTLTALAVQGRDVKLAEARVAGYRNFATKLWNAARFCQMNGAVPVEGFDPATCRETVNRWLVGKLADAAGRADAALDGFRFNDYAETPLPLHLGHLLRLVPGVRQADADWAATTPRGRRPAPPPAGRSTASWRCCIR